MSKIAEYYSEIKQNFANDPALERTVQTYLGSLVTQIYYQSMNSTAGYCHKFTLPLSQVLKLAKTLNISLEEMEKAFRADWGYPSSQTKMYSDKILSL